MRVHVEVRFVVIDVTRLHADADGLPGTDIDQRGDVEVMRPTAYFAARIGGADTLEVT
jgi:hypothetical protein